MRLLLFLALIIPASAVADDDAADSARVYRMNEVTVTGSRMSADVKTLPSSVSVIGQQAIELSNGSSVSDILQGAPGVFMKTYGASGSLQTISARGMGPEYTLILVDGQRYTNFQNGQVDLGIFPAADVERIEVARGGYSSLFGADAVGGVVNIVTKKPEPGMHASVQAGGGSYGYQHYQLSMNGGTERYSLKGTYRNEQSSNMFDCWFHDGAKRQLLQRTNADYAIALADVAASLKTGETMNSSASIRYTKSDRGTPSALTSAFNTGGAARLLDGDYFAQLGTEWKPSDESRLSVHSNFHYWEQHYSDPSLLSGGKPALYYYVNRSAMLAPQYETSLGAGHSLAVGAELVHAWIVSSEVRSTARTQLSAFLSSTHALKFQAGLPLELTVFPSIRLDRFSDVGTSVNPKVGFNAGIEDFDALRLRASIGKNFRVPTFNELYWKTGGNPDLVPEHSLSVDAGVLSTVPFFGVVDFEANYFYIDSRDRILWLPGANNLWSPKNIRHVQSQGVELSARWSLLDDAVTLGYTQNIMRVVKKNSESASDPTAGKQLPFLPEASASIDASLRYAGVTLSLRAAVTGQRYSTEDNNPLYALDPFATVDANIGYRIVFGRTAAKVKLEVFNLFNADYEIIALQPMPLRSFRISAEFLY
ncbi:MAG: TonB-dependent receptor plug domain-containing protein [Acidobacteriota bacterium]